MTRLLTSHVDKNVVNGLKSLLFSMKVVYQCLNNLLSLSILKANAFQVFGNPLHATFFKG
jgi:hypothetical protein